MSQWDSSYGEPKSISGQIGFELDFANGDPWQCSGNRAANIQFICDHNKEKATLTFTETLQCTYKVTLTSKHCCPQEGPGPGPNNDPSNSGLSGGSIFLILVFVLFSVYCMAGAFYNHRYKEEKLGLDLIPQKQFWFTSCPRYTKDGCIFSYNWCRSCIYNCRESGFTSRAHRFSSTASAL